jgi:hypothetical protein
VTADEARVRPPDLIPKTSRRPRAPIEELGIWRTRAAVRYYRPAADQGDGDGQSWPASCRSGI